MELILLNPDEKCYCSCATKCPLGKIGSTLKCTKQDLENEGFKTLTVKKSALNKFIRNLFIIDGKDKEFVIK